MASRQSLRAAQDRAISFDPGTLLTVTVGSGPHQQNFSVHESIICARSEFFRRAMSNDWNERKERLVKLPEDDPKIFTLYINLVYANCIPSTVTDPNPPDSNSEYLAPSRLYVLSERLQDMAAKNSTMDAIWAASKEKSSTGGASMTDAAILAMYAGTPKGSKGRQFMAELASTFNLSILSQPEDTLPKDFFFDLAVCLRNDRPAKRFNIALIAEASRYHEFKK